MDLDPLCINFHMIMSCERSEPLITFQQNLVVSIIFGIILIFSLHMSISAQDFINI